MFLNQRKRRKKMRRSENYRKKMNKINKMKKRKKKENKKMNEIIKQSIKGYLINKIDIVTKGKKQNDIVTYKGYNFDNGENTKFGQYGENLFINYFIFNECSSETFKSEIDIININEFEKIKYDKFIAKNEYKFKNYVNITLLKKNKNENEENFKNINKNLPLYFIEGKLNDKYLSRYEINDLLEKSSIKKENCICITEEEKENIIDSLEEYLNVNNLHLEQLSLSYTETGFNSMKISKMGTGKKYYISEIVDNIKDF